jgi:hypothetical protein
MSSTWDAVLQSDDDNNVRGITSLKEALDSQDLSPAQYQNEWKLLKTFCVRWLPQSIPIG